MIFAANHASHIDTPLLLTTLPVEFRHRTVVAAASDYFFDRTWKSVLWSFALAAIPIERSKVNRRSADTAAELVEDGWNLVIFPEGGRSPDGWTQPFHGRGRLPGPAHRAAGGPGLPARDPPRAAQDARSRATGTRRLGHRVAPGRPAAPLPHRRALRRAHDARRGRERPPLLGPGGGRGRHAVRARCTPTGGRPAARSARSPRSRAPRRPTGAPTRRPGAGPGRSTIRRPAVAPRSGRTDTTWPADRELGPQSGMCSRRASSSSSSPNGFAMRATGRTAGFPKASLAYPVM